MSALIPNVIKRLASTVGAALVGFIQAGAGAVLRTLQDKVREQVSIKDFGAKGDGVTDDTAAVLAAANYAVSIGARLVAPPGVYVVNNLTLPANIWLTGAGSQNSNSNALATTVFKCTTGTFCIATTAAPATSGYRLENFTIIGHNAAQYGLIAVGTSGFLHNLVVTDVTNGVGIRYSKAWRGGFDSVYINNCAVGLLLGFANEAVNGTAFTNVTIELCTVGLYSYPITLPQIGNVFNATIIEGCGTAYHVGTWPAFLPLSAGFTADTGMTTANVQGAIILEQNFYAQWNGLYLEINSGIYFWQGNTGYTAISSGIIEMLEPANTYTGSPIYWCRSPVDVSGVRLTWDDTKASPLIQVSNNMSSTIRGLIFNTAGTVRALYFDYFLNTGNIRVGSWALMLRDRTMLLPKSQTQTNTVYSIPLAGANLRIPCHKGTVFLLDGLNQNIGLDADFPVDGQRITLVARQDATGGRGITLAAATFISSWTNAGNAAGKVSSMSFVYSATVGKFVQECGANVWL